MTQKRTSDDNPRLIAFLNAHPDARWAIETFYATGDEATSQGWEDTAALIGLILPPECREGTCEHVAESTTVSHATKTDRERIAVRDHACPICRAQAGFKCRRATVQLTSLAHPHPARIALVAPEVGRDR